MQAGVAIAGGLGLVAALAGATPEIASPPIPPDAVRAGVNMRQALGFPADPAYVADIEARRWFGDPTISVANGVAFTQAESAELRIRDGLQGNVIRVGNYGSSQPDSYAGMYLDHGTIVARFTRDVDGNRARLAALVDYPDRLRVTHADWTVSDLTAAVEQVRASASLLPALGASLVGIATSPVENRVIVLVDRITDAVSELFAAAYPAGLVTLQVGAPAQGDSG